MILRCVRTTSTAPFIPGRSYDVAEILEYPEHVMVKTPTGHWPRPGSRWFAWHPDEFFAPPKTSLPAVSCGYQHVEIAASAYGVVNPASSHPHIQKLWPLLEDILHASKLPLWYHGYRNVLTLRSSPKLEKAFTLVGINHDRLGRDRPYKSADAAIKRVLSRLDLSHLSTGIGDLDLGFWHKTTRPPGGLTWTPWPRRIS
jgi:hypothetical protein